MQARKTETRLIREADRVLLCRHGERIPVRLVWTRPITQRGGAFSLLDGEKKEVLMLNGLDALDADSRRVAEEELSRRYLMPRITRVIRTQAHFGTRYWHVQTDHGERRFAMKHASKHAVWLTEDHLVLRDTLGCLYEVRPFSELDSRSKSEVEKVI